MRDPLKLPEGWMGRIGRYSIVTSSKIRGRHKGTHKSRQFGASQEFSDFREYHAGDDVRLIDWNVFARTDHFYIKRFLDEQEMHTAILLDSSASMDDKWQLAKQLAFTLGVVVLRHDDRLSVGIARKEMKPYNSKGKTARQQLEKVLADCDRPTEQEFASKAHRYIEQRQAVLFIISDGLEELEAWDFLFRRLIRKSKDIRLLLLSTPDERSPVASGDVRFLDSETSAAVRVTVNQYSVNEYRERRTHHLKSLESVCQSYGIRLLHVHAEEGLYHALQLLVRKNWIH